MSTPVNSIVIPERFVRACAGWEGDVDCRLRAVTSTGNLTTGTIRPAGCDGDKEKWYLTIWRELSCDLGGALCMALLGHNGESDEFDAKVLIEFEYWVDAIVARLEEEYGLADWDACDG